MWALLLQLFQHLYYRHNICFALCKKVSYHLGSLQLLIYETLLAVLYVHASRNVTVANKLKIMIQNSLA